MASPSNTNNVPLPRRSLTRRSLTWIAGTVLALAAGAGCSSSEGLLGVEYGSASGATFTDTGEPGEDETTGDEGLTNDDTGPATGDGDGDMTGDGDGDGEADSGAVPSLGDCDPFLQDCDEGLKCSWVAGEFGNTTVCVPLPEQPAPDGANCAMADAYDPFDPCELGSVCAFPDAYGVGVCTPLCEGNVLEPACADDNQVCQPCPDCPSICMDRCDPLDASCGDGMLCAPSIRLNTFICTFDATSDNGGQQGDACEFANECGAGLACITGSKVPGCDAGKCCAPYCELGLPEACDPETTCTPWPFSAPLPDYEYLGVCADLTPAAP